MPSQRAAPQLRLPAGPPRTVCSPRKPLPPARLTGKEPEQQAGPPSRRPCHGRSLVQESPLVRPHARHPNGAAAVYWYVPSFSPSRSSSPSPPCPRVPPFFCRCCCSFISSPAAQRHRFNPPISPSHRAPQGYTMQRRKRDVLMADFNEVESLYYPRYALPLPLPHPMVSLPPLALVPFSSRCLPVTLSSAARAPARRHRTTLTTSNSTLTRRWHTATFATRLTLTRLYVPLPTVVLGRQPPPR